MSKSPIFPMPEPQHYSDYGFDPQIDYFQVLEEARRHRKRSEVRSLDALHFKLQKPISKDDATARKKRRRWWKSALLFWKRAKAGGDDHCDAGSAYGPKVSSPCISHPYRAVSGPLYATESARSSTPCRTSRPSSGPLAAAEVGAAGIPYLSLRDLNLVDGARVSASAAPTPIPIYLVT
ncbi:uncharacterized protein LOC103695999 [Phoenix dactylifera]|uniref:Uncharacterized protein LOC103695999 n=1 Tax=Phoenix dactylifera TaxID=42345 RepID=A0A8B7BFP2_PHODC|nr:uncharacterized protein LOC103695999 [Phoenix dactylifera]